LYRSFGKRLADFSVASLSLVLFIPVMVLVALMVRRHLGTPVLFRQRRPGLQADPFTILKFRTMTDERDGRGALLPDEARLTKFGAFLRGSSLDELPELWNVIKGEMSLVGPRPLLMQYLDLYSAEQMRRHDVRPGITGWAQVNGRNTIAWEDKFKLDVWYTEHLSPVLDLKILAMTILSMLRREGINQPGHASMSEFK
jgi:lipopolysaccharide/colanic/teichoic acid biosynthesis glycosyltransferase